MMSDLVLLLTQFSSRPINHSDLLSALRQVKATVSPEDLELYLDWDNKYGASS